MSDRPMIYESMANAIASISAISKKKKNQQQGFMYRGIDDVMNALNPVLAKHKLFLTPEVLEHTREERQTQRGGNLIYSVLKVKYTVYAIDGSSVSAIVIGEGMDSADKSSNKAMSVAMKYAMFQLFCIPTEDMAGDDPDRENPPESRPLLREPAANVAVTTTDRVPELQQPSGLDRHKAMEDAIKRLGLDGTADFVKKVNELKKEGVVVDKLSKDMTDEEFLEAIEAVANKYGGVRAETGQAAS